MNLFDVYPLFDIQLTKGNGCYVYDNKDNKYLDFYGGHAVISIGHAHPTWTKAIENQLHLLPYYSNSVQIENQKILAQKLGNLSGCQNYNLFLVNSGAEANENALKIASFYNNRKKVIAFHGSFHGRTAAAVAVTDNAKIKPPINDDSHVIFLPFNDEKALENTFAKHEICAVIIEPIQGVNGIFEPTPAFLQKIQQLCNTHNSIFIIDEIQSGYGRSGKFFAHQWSNVTPDIITTAKGMGNGFPIGGVFIHEKIKPHHGMLGTTFGGSPTACAAAIAVVEVIEEENLVANALEIGNYAIAQLAQLKEVKEVRGKGLMLGVEFNFPIKDLRNKLLFDHHIFTGNASNANTLRLLPSLSITNTEIDILIEAIKKSI